MPSLDEPRGQNARPLDAAHLTGDALIDDEAATAHRPVAGEVS